MNELVTARGEWEGIGYGIGVAICIQDERARLVLNWAAPRSMDMQGFAWPELSPQENGCWNIRFFYRSSCT